MSTTTTTTAANNFQVNMKHSFTWKGRQHKHWNAMLLLLLLLLLNRTVCSTLSLSGVLPRLCFAHAFCWSGHLFSRSPSFFLCVSFFRIFCCPFLSEVENVRYFTLSLWFLAVDHFHTLFACTYAYVCIAVFVCSFFFVVVFCLANAAFYIQAHLLCRCTFN